MTIPDTPDAVGIARDLVAEHPDTVLAGVLAELDTAHTRIARLEAALAAAQHRADSAEALVHALARPRYDPTRISLEDHAPIGEA